MLREEEKNPEKAQIVASQGPKKQTEVPVSYQGANLWKNFCNPLNKGSDPGVKR